jgi:hypothetical protein
MVEKQKFRVKKTSILRIKKWHFFFLKSGIQIFFFFKKTKSAKKKKQKPKQKTIKITNPQFTAKRAGKSALI